jgi:heat shock protein HslJ
MTVTDARGYRNSAAQFIEILAPPEPTAVPTQEPAPTPEATSQPTDTPTPELLPPQAAINGPAAGFPGEPILFDAGASVPGSSPIGSYHWDFGDGTTSGPSADTGTTKIYNRAGTYDVSLIVTDQNGLSSSAPLQVAIQARLDSDVWSLLNLLDQPLVPGTAITAQFMNGAIAGFAGCNSYSGTYTAQENPDGTYTLAIRDLSTSRQTCPEEVMRQEQLFLAQFATVLLARVDQMNTLILSYPEGIAPNGEPYNAGELTFYDRGKPTPR